MYKLPTLRRRILSGVINVVKLVLEIEANNISCHVNIKFLASRPDKIPIHSSHFSPLSPNKYTYFTLGVLDFLNQISIL